MLKKYGTFSTKIAMGWNPLKSGVRSERLEEKEEEKPEESKSARNHKLPPASFSPEGNHVNNVGSAVNSALDMSGETNSEGKVRLRDQEGTAPSFSTTFHDPFHILALGICFISQLLSVILYLYFFLGDSATREWLFGGPPGRVFSANQTLWIHPNWNGKIWCIIVQILAFPWIIYGITTVFRKVPSGETFLYVSATIIPTATYVFWTMSLIFFDVLPFVVLRHSAIYNIPFVFASAVCAYFATYNTAVSVEKALPFLKKKQMNKDVDLATGLAIGGPAKFAALGTYQLVVSVCHIVTDDLEILSDETCCSLALVFIFLFQIAMFVVETWVFDAYLRGMHEHYLIMAVLLGFISSNPNVNPDSFFHKLNIAMIVFTCLGYVLRVVIARRRDMAEKKAEEQLNNESEFGVEV